MDMRIGRDNPRWGRLVEHHQLASRETLRQRTAHAGAIEEDTLVYRIEFHAVSPS